MTINKKISEYDKIILSILLTFAIILLTLDYYFAYNNMYFSNEIFWLSIIISAIVLVQMLYIKSTNLKIAFLLVLGFILVLPSTLRSPEFSIFVDEIIHLQTARLIFETGTLDINNSLLEISKSYPGIELVAVSLSNMTKLSIFYSGKIIVILLHSLILLSIFLTFRKLMDENFAYLGSLVYATNTRFSFFHSIFSYETLGILIVILIIYLFVKHANSLAMSDKVLIVILIIALTVTHHFSSYMLILFLCIYTLIEIKNRNFLLRLTVLFGLVILSWIVYIAISTTINYYGNIFIDKVKDVIVYTISEDSSGTRKILVQPIPIYERVMAIMYFPLVGLLSLIGLYYYGKKGYLLGGYDSLMKGSLMKNSLIKVLMIYGPILFFVIVPFIFTRSYDFYRPFAFLFIGISFVSTITLLGFYKYKPLIMALYIALIVGGTSIGIGPTARTPDYSANFASEMSTVTKDVYAGADWFEQNFGRYNKVLGDRTIIFVYGGYAIQKIGQSSWRVFYPETMDKNVTSLIDWASDFIIVDKRITELFPTIGYYFGIEERTTNKPYGVTIPLPKENIDKFNNDLKIYRIYDNGNIITYREYY